MKAIKNIEKIVTELVKKNFDEVTVKGISTFIEQFEDECTVTVDVAISDVRYRYDTDHQCDVEQFVDHGEFEFKVLFLNDEEPGEKNLEVCVWKACADFKFDHRDMKDWVNEPEFNYD